MSDEEVVQVQVEIIEEEPPEVRIVEEPENPPQIFVDVKPVIESDHRLLSNRGASEQHPISAITGLQTELDSKIGYQEFLSHTDDKNNPHEVTKAQVGLGNVANVDTTNASNITSGTLNNDRLDTIPYSKLSGVASSAQGEKADSSLQPNDNITQLTNNAGYITKEVNNLTYYTKTADLPAVPTKTSDLTNDSGFITKDVNDLTNYTLTSDLGDLATKDTITSSDISGTIPYSKLDGVASAVQGTKADSALQPNDLSATSPIAYSNKTISVDTGYQIPTTTQVEQIAINTSSIATINGMIPEQAGSSNQLADKQFVNSSIATNTANYISNNGQPFTSVAQLEAYTGTVTNNDYAFVTGLDEHGNTYFDRYKATVSGSTVTWAKEYRLNNSSFTANQWDAINSGITSSDVALISTAIQPNDNVSELTNDAGYITGISSSDVTTALGYTPYNSSNPNGYQTATQVNTSITGYHDSTKANVDDLGTLAYSDTITNGDISGTINQDKITNLTTDLGNKVTKNIAITGATKCKITYDSKGLVTSGADLSASDIPSLSLSKITDVTASATELNYTDGVTSNIQTQLDSKQDTLVSGTNIKTINNQSLLGSGDITISGGAWGSITGTLSDQTDLNTALNQKVPLTNVTSKGSTTTPVFFNSSGVAQPITSYDGNAASATTLTGLTATVAELNYTDGVTSNIQTQLDGKQDTLVSGSNIKTINNTTLLGSGNITLPTRLSDVAVAGSGIVFSYGYDYSRKNFTEVGAVTITNGVVSGFTSSNYITLPQSAAEMGSTFFIKVTTGNSFNSNKYIYNKEGFDALWITSNRNLGTWNWRSNSFETIRSNMPYNTTFWIKVVLETGKRTYYLSTDGYTYDSGKVVNDTSYVVGSEVFYLGYMKFNEPTWGWNGRIDLNETYIKNSSSTIIWRPFEVSDKDGISTNLSVSNIPSIPLSKISDVSVSSPTNGQTLQYNTTTNKWENATISTEIPVATTSSLGGVKPDGTTITVTADGTIRTNTSSNNLLDFKWTDHLLNDQSWTRADTFSWQNGTTYSNVYSELLEEYNNASSTNELDGNSFIQPTLSANGTLGGTSFAVSASNITNYDAYKPFSANANSTATDTWTASGTSADFTIYNPIALYFRSIKIWNRNDTIDVHAITSGTVYGSNDGSTWTQITTFSNNITTIASEWTIDLSNNSIPYKYIKLSCVNSTGTAAIGFGKVALEAYYNKWIEYKRTPKGYKIADATQETFILNKYNSDGIAWYYILDTANTQFKLPRTKFGFDGLRGNVGDDIDESLPNITGRFGRCPETATTDGAFTRLTDTTTDNIGSHGTTNSSIAFNASLSSSTYQNNAPVQERATQMYLYFYVGEFSQSATEQTAGLNAEMFNRKLDVSTYNDNPRTNAVYLKTTYVDGTSGYRIWSDGYCEQWGYYSVSSGGTSNYTVSLLKTFADTNYNALGTVIAQGVFYVASPITRNTDSIIYRVTGYGTGSTHSGFMWRVFGYLANGEY